MTREQKVEMVAETSQHTTCFIEALVDDNDRLLEQLFGDALNRVAIGEA